MADWDCSGPTVVPFPRFDPVEDAKVLRKAMKGLGTDEDRIIEIIPNRTNSQRQEISEAFTAEFNRDLVKDLTSELSGNFRKLILALMEPPMVYLAKELNNAMRASGPDYGAITELVCVRTYEEVSQISDIYESTYNQALLDGVESQLSDDYKKMLTPFLHACSSSSRDEDDINLEKAKEQATQVHEWGKAEEWGDSDEEAFIHQFVHQPLAQLRLIRREHDIRYGYAKDSLSLDDIIEKRFSGELKTGLLTFVKVAKGKQFYFADRIELALKSMGRDHSPLIRILVSRSELDLEVIKQMYFKTQGMELVEALSGETSGDYRKTIKNLIQSP